jgi:hypothetical protein
MRVGRRANTSVGRFAKLLMLNMAGIRFAPEETDGTAIGISCPVALAEDEDFVRAIGWPTFGDDRGVPVGRSAVTVQSVIAISPPLFYGRYPHDDVRTYLEPIIDVFGKGICGYWVFLGLKFGEWHPTLILSRVLAQMLKDDRGWTKDDLRQYMYKEATVSVRDLELRGDNQTLNLATQVQKGIIPPGYFESDDPDRLVSAFFKPESIKIIVAGNPDSYVNQGYMNNHAQGIPITRIIDS